MTDKELLELAAKAEGHGVEFDELSGLTYYENKFTGLWWNPLENDGDALRLAIKLRIRFEILHTERHVAAFHNDFHGGIEEESDDLYAATRRAIVKAAAEIAKAKGE